MSINKNKLTKRGKEIYNEGVRDALRELWRYDGLISDPMDRKYLVDRIQAKVSYKEPAPKKIRTI